MQNQRKFGNNSLRRPAFGRVKLISMPVSIHEQITRPMLPQNEEIAFVCQAQSSTSRKSSLRYFVNSTTFKCTVGLILGIGCLYILFHFVNINETFQLLQQNLSQPHGVLFTLFASGAFLLAFVFRALRWKLFLKPVKNVSTINVIQLFLVGVFLNFLLPIRAGELAKSFILRRTHSLPINQSLSTITIDKAMDLLPAFFILPIVPLLGLHLDGRFWYVLGAANIGLFGFILFIGLVAWQRSTALELLYRITSILPAKFAAKISTFVLGFVDALLISAKSPRRLFTATLLTFISVTFDGLYNFFAFWTVGTPISIGQAIFGYLLFNLFYILPNPPGQIGSNEVVGLLIFTGLFHIPPTNVTAMIVFFHVWSGLLMIIIGMTSLSALGVTLSSTLKLSTGKLPKNNSSER